MGTLMPRKRRLYGMWIFNCGRSGRGRRSAAHRSIGTIRLGVEGGSSFVVATTRPELLAACVCYCCSSGRSTISVAVRQTRRHTAFRAPVPILADERASIEKAPAYSWCCTGDATDVEWWRQFDLPLRQVAATAGSHVQFGSPGWRASIQMRPTRFTRRCKGNTSSKRGGPSLIFSARKAAAPSGTRSAIDPRASAYRTCRQVLREG